MLQAELFTRSRPNMPFLGAGCYGTVHALPCGEWVMKTARKDGTLNYLEWCYREQQAGRGMRGMPLMDALAHTDAGYMATMRKYSDLRTGQEACSNGYLRVNDGDYDEFPYLEELVTAYRNYMARTFGGRAHNYANDLHGGNHMYDRESDTWVITDPCSSGYQPCPINQEFVLQ